ncbi:hypothetical protein FEZ33_01165 [Ruoffia tabacinasalis]|uniref:Uncharacterized protein n=1 Tax=Ruoffia tabacinasalis TaxID=87458 RepID=A0A5R9EJV6_9LACT|nr:hypothetical protein [Ruoffia tabacinasalis]TLQ49273.1 hypothetical protein FEZ33_01165 [Ruoffia tabacinasalis]
MTVWDYTPIGPKPLPLQVGKISPIGQQIARDVRLKGYGEDTKEAMARIVEWADILNSYASEVSETARILYNEYYRQYSDVITELSKDQDYYSLPEIAGARGGFDTLGERLNETTAQLAQTKSEAERKRRLEDLDSEVLAAIEGGEETEFNLLTIPQDDSATMSKIKSTFDFWPRTTKFKKRSVNSAGEYTSSTVNYASDFIPIYDSYETLVNNDKKYRITVVFFNDDNEAVHDMSWQTDDMDIKSIIESKPDATKFVVRVSNLTGSTMQDDLGDYLSSTIYVKTNRHPARTSDLSKVELNEWLKRFPSANFDRGYLTVDNNSLALGQNIATSYHKWLAYADTDTSREISHIKANFIAKTNSSNRIFIESTDGRVVWLSLGSSNIIEAYTLNKFDGTFAPIIHKYGRIDLFSYPSENETFSMTAKIVGKLVVVYIDDLAQCAYDLSGYIGDKITKCGLAYRGNKSTPNTVKNFEISYQNDNFMHISIDDTFSVLKDLTINASSYATLFDHADFAFMKSMHEQYGAVFSLYLFNQVNGDSFNLEAMTNKFKQEFSENSHWLKLGYHSDAEDTYANTLTDSALVANVKSVYAQIQRFASKDNIDLIPRFGFFSVNKSGLAALKAQGLIMGALTADDARTENSGLSGVGLDVARSADRFVDMLEELHYFRTETRLDGMSGTDVVNLLNSISLDQNNRKNYILFSHSIDHQPLESAIKWSFEKQIGFGYPMNNV